MTDPTAWIVERENDKTFPRFYKSKAGADAMVNFVTAYPRAIARPLYLGAPQCEVQSEALADQIHDACPHKIDEPPNCALVKNHLECVCEHVHMHAIRAARSGDAAGSGCVAQAVTDPDAIEFAAALIVAPLVGADFDKDGCSCPECEANREEAREIVRRIAHAFAAAPSVPSAEEKSHG